MKEEGKYAERKLRRCHLTLRPLCLARESSFLASTEVSQHQSLCVCVGKDEHSGPRDSLGEG